MYDWAEFRHFRYLLTILELRGFRAAAEQLNTGQPNLSIQAKQFQENASVRLYEKAKDGRIKPTDTGVAFQFIAKSVLEAREEAFEALAAIERRAITSVRFGCSPLADQTLFQSFCKMHRELLPSCAVRPERDDTMPLVEDVLAGVLDAAIVTRPIEHAALRVEDIQCDRLVVCLRKDDPLASKNALTTLDLQKHLTILYHPQRHPMAHARLLELLRNAGVELEEHSRASHPNEMQTLVKEGYGLALIRQGSTLESELTTRPIAGVNWTVDTVLIYHQERHPKTLPVLVRRFKRQLRKNGKQAASTSLGRASEAPQDKPTQLTLLS
ncbi:DNA-binding transcriptional LysR family regulator [Granulicella aggregans]|uniref:DNA-binding transcriptional LysR family regulator n=1 Tax=Granulicella aggregans TaxID=474949 RepID=A0A7W7ZH49_9BACT|nr:LysR family transcriptional regulator [Granulicella aggregans]MBB5059706.1 DNA-binding transcriptional LysR family regulator [Granulicella aggregans]